MLVLKARKFLFLYKILKDVLEENSYPETEFHKTKAYMKRGM